MIDRMEMPDLVVRGRTFDPVRFGRHIDIVRMLAAVTGPWVACAEEFRCDGHAVRLSTNVDDTLTLVHLEEGTASSSYDVPWDVSGGRDVADAAEAIAVVAAYMELVHARRDDPWLVESWILGIGAILTERGDRPVIVRLSTRSHGPTAVSYDLMKPIRNDLMDRLGSACPVAVIVEMQDDDTVWIQRAGALVGDHDELGPLRDPVATLRATTHVLSMLQDEP